MKNIHTLLFLSALTVNTATFANDVDNHEHSHTERSEEPNHEVNISDEHQEAIQLSQQQMTLADISVAPLHALTMSTKTYAPGEIKTNGYTSYYVSPRVESVVVKRHATLGERVKAGQALVTLFSETIASVQADYRIAYADWLRVKNLTSATVSAKQKLAAKTAFIAAKSRLKAYGLSEKAITLLSESHDSLLGEYTLNAQREGAVIADDFHQGQRIAAGTSLMVLADESQVWVEAQLPATSELELHEGSQALVTISGDSYQAKVIQSAHTIDPNTRTRIVRLLVNNSKDKLHSGMFVDVSFLQEVSTAMLAVPQSALMRGNDGDWQVFIEQESGLFIAHEVTLGRQVIGAKNSTPLQEVMGIDAGQRIVLQGAFFIASQAAKSGFDAHNH